MVDPTPFRRADGSAIFTCIGCGLVVYSAIYVNKDCRCLPCQFIYENPNLSGRTKALLRGETDV